MIRYDNSSSESITGVVEGVVFRNDSNSYTVMDVSVKGELVTCVGILPEIAPGEKVEMTGRWESHQSFGRQFKISEFKRTMPENSAQFLKYLASGTIKGIGPKTAGYIVERFGDRTFEVIENEPERLAFVKGISKDKAKKISAEFKKQYAVRTVIVGLEKYGLSASECVEVFKHFGTNAVELIKENPYILCQALRTVDFERAENIALKLDEQPKPVHRLRAGITHVVSHNLLNGHTCLPKDKLLNPCAELLSVSTDDISDSIDEMVEERLLSSYAINGREFIFMPEIYASELNIAQRLKLLTRFAPNEEKKIGSDIKKIEKDLGIKYAKAQSDAIEKAVHNGIFVLTGGPGTGKTTTVKGIIKYFERKNLEILLAAPTGRAAKRMSELTGYEAKTIHRLLEVEWDDSDKPVFKRNISNPLGADVIILDEVSMVDVTLFSSFLDAVRFGCRLIMVGDSDQLPAVGAGNVLLDIINSGTVEVVRLNEIFRQARQSLIVMNAHAVISGEEPVLDDKTSDFFFMERPASTLCARTVAELCTKRLPDAYGYSPFTDIQVLCPSRKGDCGTVNLNRRLQDILNPESEDKKQCTINGRLFRQGDKIMQIKNNYDITWTKNGEDGIGIFNGDMGIIKKIDLKGNMLEIDFDDGKNVKYPVESLSELELAYAVTVHKSQGSEYDAVVMPVCDAPPQLMYRNLLYTAVTRAKKLLIIVGNRSKLLSMVANDRQNKRYSALYAFLKDDEISENALYKVR